MQTMTFNEWRLTGVTAVACRGILVSALLLLALPQSFAVEVPSLYTVEVPRDPADPDGKRVAEQAALVEVLGRITGTMTAAESPQMLELFPNPDQYVLRRQTGPDDTERLTLDGASIERLVRRAGATIWGSNRPLTLVLMGVDWGQGKREIVAAVDDVRRGGAQRSIDPNRILRERVEDVAERRGIPVVFPRLDTAEAETLNFTDVWGGFDEPLWQVAERYGAVSLLVGRIRPDSRQQNRWTWFHADQRRVWNGASELAVNSLADAMAALYAVGGDTAIEDVQVTVSGVDSVKTFAEVQRLMENLNNVDHLQVRSATAGTITYSVTLQGGAERLDRMLQLSGLLEPITASQHVQDLPGNLPDKFPDNRLDGGQSANNAAQSGATSMALHYLFRTD